MFDQRINRSTNAPIAAIPEVETSDQLVTKRKPKGKDASPMATAEPAEPVAPAKTVAKLTGRGKKKAEPEATDDGMYTFAEISVGSSSSGFFIALS